MLRCTDLLRDAAVLPEIGQHGVVTFICRAISFMSKWVPDVRRLSHQQPVQAQDLFTPAGLYHWMKVRLQHDRKSILLPDPCYQRARAGLCRIGGTILFNSSQLGFNISFRLLHAHCLIQGEYPDAGTAETAQISPAA